RCAILVRSSSLSIVISPILACRSRRSASLMPAESLLRLFRAFSPPDRNSSRQAEIRLASWPVSRESASRLSPFNRRITISVLRRADHRFSRGAGALGGAAGGVSEGLVMEGSEGEEGDALIADTDQGRGPQSSVRGDRAAHHSV